MLMEQTHTTGVYIFASSKFASPRGATKGDTNMLEDSLFESQDRKKTRKPLTVAIAAVAHAVTIGVLVLIPLLQMQALPLPPVNLSLLAPRVDVPIITTAFSGQPRVQKSPIPLPDTLTAPESIPRDVIKVVDDFVPPIVGLMPSGGGSRGPVLTDLLNPRVGELAPVDAPPPPPLPPPPPVVKAAPYRLGGNVQAGNLIHQVNPAYPQLARQARVQGVVVLEAVIKD